MVMIGSFYVRLPFSYKKTQKGTENYDENNGKKTGSTKKPGDCQVTIFRKILRTQDSTVRSLHMKNQ